MVLSMANGCIDAHLKSIENKNPEKDLICRFICTLSVAIFNLLLRCQHTLNLQDSLNFRGK